MSQTTQKQPGEDAYLDLQKAPPLPLNPDNTPGSLILDPTFGTVALVTPIGRVAGEALKKPMKYQDNPKENFFLRLLFNAASCDGTVPDILQAVCMVAQRRFPDERRADPATGQEFVANYWHLLHTPTDQGGLHNPLNDGNLTFAKDPAKNGIFKGRKWINISLPATNAKGQPNSVTCLGPDGAPINPACIYPGCYARAWIQVAPFPGIGKTGSNANRGVSFFLKSVQFIRDGEKLSNYDAVSASRNAFAGAGAAPAAPAGFAPTPGAVAGGPPAGFAAPPLPGASPSGPGVGGGSAPPWTPPGT